MKNFNIITMKQQLLLIVAFLQFSFGVRLWAQCDPGQDTTPPVIETAGDGTLNSPFRNLLPSTVGAVPSGTYYFNFNGATFQGVLDNDTDGGGWLMILNYVHLAGDNSELSIRNTDLPLLGSSTVGDNEAGTPNWGHMGNALAAAIDFEEMRFYGETTDHERIINFTTRFASAVNYVKTGTGSFDGITIRSNHTELDTHTANIPIQGINEFSDQGDLALTNFPFWAAGAYHWGIRGLGNRWEVDDFAQNTASTIHRVWVRGDLSPVATRRLEVTLDPSGNLTVAPEDFGLTITDNCGSATLSLSQTNFDCSHIGSNTLQLTATDAQNNSTVTEVMLEITDNAPVITNDVGVNFDLDASGNVSITLDDINASATDDCGLESLTLNRTDFSCNNVGPNFLELTAVDVQGNVTNKQVIIIINDPIAPVVECRPPFSIVLDAEGSALITQDDVILNVTDNCVDNLNISIDRTTFTCADIGENMVTLTVRDTNGNSTQCTTTVTVTIPECPSNFTLESDATTCGTVYNYPCASNITSGPPSGTLLDLGTTSFQYETLDNTGATVTCSYDVTVVDTRAPIFNTKDFAATLEANATVTVTAADILGEDPLARDYILETSGTVSREDISSTGTVVTLDDDEVSAALPIGFSFGFYGNLYNDFYISSNGFITFNANEDDGCCNGQNIPDSNEPNNLIAFDWNDIDPEEGGTIRYETIGVAPNRILIMDWDNVTHIDNSNNVTTSQVKLFEGSNRIEIHTTNIPLTDDSKTQGIENSDGTAAIVVPGRNAANWGATDDFVAFIPTVNTFDNCDVEGMEVFPNTFSCSNTGANTVTLTLTDVNGNSASKTATVTISTTDTTPPALTLNGDIPQIIQQGEGYTELGATTDADAVLEIDTSDFQDAVGSYTIRYTATDASCNATELTRTVEVVDQTLNISTNDAVNFTMYPNPAQNYIHIETQSPIETLKIFDINGAVVKHIKGAKANIDVSNLAAAIYYIQVHTAKGKAIRKLVKL